MNIKRRTTLLLGTFSMLSLSLTACIRPAQPYLNKGIALSQAGFIAHPANTTARYTLMNLLPPGSLTYRPSAEGMPIYLYADPVACGCVYMGDQKAYENLKIILSSSHKQEDKHNSTDKSSLPEELQPHNMIAENRRDTAAWDWTVWSPAADPDNNQPRHMIGNYW